MTDQRLRNKREAAHFLGVSPGTLERLMRRGLPYVKVGDAKTCTVRFRPEDLADFVERRVHRVDAFDSETASR